VTICSALVSAFTGRKVFRDVGMTGEITLRGRVLPVGGVREKVLAAHRAGLKTVILPRYNLKDLVEIPRKARSEMKIVPVEHMDQVLEVALGPQPVLEEPAPARKSHSRRKKSEEKAAEAPAEGQGSPESPAQAG
jgi:ATP-dependent Lon protease